MICMSRVFKIFLIIIIIIAFSICTNVNFVYAGEEDENDKHPLPSLTFREAIKKSDAALNNAEKEADEDFINKDNIQEFSKSIFRDLFIIGVVLSVIIGGIIGIKFMISSAEDKAKVKEIMIPYVIGCVVIFGAFGIWKVTVEILSILNQ